MSADDYVMKVKAPKNCYTCKHLSTDQTDFEMQNNDHWYVCARDEGRHKSDDINKFENAMPKYKRCWEPIEGMHLGWNKWIKVKLL